MIYRGKYIGKTVRKTEVSHMLKVFLVEDEFVVREGIKNNIDWTGNDYEFCGEASDGELAFPMIQKIKPDIVITDIRMPFMDGLTLSKLIKKELPGTEIIILTGYEEFEYAKEGIKLGVAQYLTKPINGEELLREVDAVAVRIKERRAALEIKEKYMKEMEENYRKEQKELFQYLVTGRKSMEELLEIANGLHLNLSSLWYNIVLLKMQFENQVLEEYSNTFIELEERIDSLADKSHIIIFDRNLEGKAFLFKADSKEELLQVQQTFLDELMKIWTACEDLHYFGGIGKPVNRLRELPLSFEAASHAFAHRYLVQDNLILDSSEIDPQKYMEKDQFNFSSVDTKQFSREKVLEFLKVGDKNEAVFFIEEFVNALDTNAMESSIFRQYITMDTYFCVAEFVENLQFSKEKIGDFDPSAGIFQSKEKSIQYIESIIKRALELRDNAASNRYGDVVDKVRQYIEDNYADEQLSLNLVASHMNFSPNHLSTVFSQQTGQTFTRYLTEYRMNRAKELLRCTGKRSSEIGLEVGYKDSHYFSYLFKKTQGMTPTQYRSERTQEGER